jgi:hypothetical protein
VEYLFDTLYNVYPLYDYFGGKEAFDEAENAILQQCEETESITAEEFQNVLLEQLSKKDVMLGREDCTFLHDEELCRQTDRPRIIVARIPNLFAESGTKIQNCK